MMVNTLRCSLHWRNNSMLGIMWGHQTNSIILMIKVWLVPPQQVKQNKHVRCTECQSYLHVPTYSWEQVLSGRSENTCDGGPSGIYNVIFVHIFALVQIYFHPHTWYYFDIERCGICCNCRVTLSWSHIRNVLIVSLRSTNTQTLHEKRLCVISVSCPG